MASCRRASHHVIKMPEALCRRTVSEKRPSPYNCTIRKKKILLRCGAGSQPKLRRPNVEHHPLTFTRSLVPFLPSSPSLSYRQFLKLSLSGERFLLFARTERTRRERRGSGGKVSEEGQIWDMVTRQPAPMHSGMILINHCINLPRDRSLL